MSAFKESERFPLSDWQYEVANGDTRLGYAEWVAQWLEADSMCDVCGESFQIDEGGIATHLDAEGGTDHDADADHVPYEAPPLGVATGGGQ